MNDVAITHQPMLRRAVCSIIESVRAQHWSVLIAVAYGLLIPVIAAHLPGVGGVGAADMLMPVAIFVCFCVRPKGRLQISHLAMMCFIVAAMVSLLQIQSAKDAIDCSIRWVRLLGILLPFFFGLFFAVNVRTIDKTIAAWACGGALAIAIGIVLHAFQIEVRAGQQKLWMDGGAQIRAGGLIGNSGAFGHMTATWCTICVGYLLSVSKHRYRLIGVVGCMLLAGYVVYVASSRAAMMHLGVASIVLVVLLPTARKFRQWLMLFGVFGLASAVVVGGAASTFGGGGGGGKLENNALKTNLERFIPGLGDANEFSSNRAENWPEYIEMMNHSVLSGWGYKMGVRLHEESPDNSYISVMLETGVFGFACMALFVCAVLARLVGLYLVGDPYAVVLIATCFGQLANCLTSDIYTFWITMPVVFLLLGLVTQPRAPVLSSLVDDQKRDKKVRATKILHFVCDGAPGGGTNHVVQLLTRLGQPDRGADQFEAGDVSSDGEIECALLTEDGTYLAEIAEGFGVQTFVGSFFKSRTDRAAVNRVKEVIDQFKPDIIHCHGGRAAFFYGRLNDSTTSFYTVHGFHFKRKSFLPRWFGWAGELFSIRRADHVVFVSHYDQKLAVSARLLPKNKSHRVIHNGIAQPKAEKSEGSLGVGFVGRMVFQKHPELFLDVIQRLPNVKAVMGGDGELEPEIQKLVQQRGLSDRVQLLGGLSHAKALDVIANLDVLVMTPRWEGLPLLPLEAMLLGVPVVSTPVGGIPEVIEHNVSGWLGSTAAELAEGVEKIVNDATFRQDIIEQARDTAQSKFAQAEMVSQLKDFYQRCSAGDQGKSPLVSELPLCDRPSERASVETELGQEDAAEHLETV